jgi:hypothetical protein
VLGQASEGSDHIRVSHLVEYEERSVSSSHSRPTKMGCKSARDSQEIRRYLECETEISAHAVSGTGVRD